MKVVWQITFLVVAKIASGGIKPDGSCLVPRLPPAGSTWRSRLYPTSNATSVKDTRQALRYLDRECVGRYYECVSVCAPRSLGREWPCPWLRPLAARRGAPTTIGPIEAALIALVIATAKDLGSIVTEVVKRRLRRSQYLRLIRDVECALREPRSPAQTIPFHAIKASGAAEELQDELRAHRVAQAQAAVDGLLADVGKCARVYAEVLPSEADQLRQALTHLEHLIAKQESPS